ncbi:MAG TPA: hypothetical protein VMZ11_08790 [Mycobacteriales bacterium]|nr:hypothetical protein [Mycobacteriales bacterium]
MAALPSPSLVRCCPTHRSWPDLAAHLLREFDIPARHLTEELVRAESAAALFALTAAEALACAELMVRNRLALAGVPRSSTRCPPTQREPDGLSPAAAR